jgi:alkylation response protein AidB-like acyl-CoA dehydrogenase
MQPEPDAGASVDTVRKDVRRWLDGHAAELTPYRKEPHGDLADAVAYFRPLQKLLYTSGWTRLGWPEACGGVGGSAVQRAAVMEELAAAGYVIPETLGSVEIIAPMLIRFAPKLAAAHVAAAIAGDEVWCQGFSEPDAGSDLGSLRTRATADGDRFRITGQKMWSSNGHIAQHCCLLARTGTSDSGYRGLTMFWIDLDTPGVTVRPVACESGRAEVAELFLDDVEVPARRVVGEVGEGWRVVMYLMQFERGAYAWQRQADLHTQLQHLIDEAPEPLSDSAPDLIGNAYLALFALRARCTPTLESLASGHDLGPEISVDKLLLSQAEQTITDTARRLLWPALEIEDGDLAATWRRRWSYSQICTIYGGAAEIQRDLVAERLLGLPRGR